MALKIHFGARSISLHPARNSRRCARLFTESVNPSEHVGKNSAYASPTWRTSPQPAIGLGLTDPHRIKLQYGTFLRFGHPRLKKFSVRLLATSTKICTMGSSTVSHENRFKASWKNIFCFFLLRGKKKIFYFFLKKKYVKYTHTQLLMISPTHSSI